MTSVSDFAWVADLANRYERATRKLDERDSALHKQLPSLQFASATLRKLQAGRPVSARAAHLVVMGPTQSGKSTLVNLLLDTGAASVSALAGFTVHSQGYAKHIDDTDIAYVDTLMSPLQRTAGDSLDSNRLDCYVLETAPTGANALISGAVVWDTPDFDSITAATYSVAVIRAAALADVIVMTVSKDKYGDKRVWDMIDLLHAMGKPMLVCVNKVSESDRSVILDAFASRYESVFGQPPPPIIILPFVERTDAQLVLPLDADTRLSLQSALVAAIDNAAAASTPEHCKRFISRYQEQWLAPLIGELDARDQWLAMTREAINDADDYYVTNYLNSPDKYETFNRALAELLTFLEIPGVAAAFVQARKAITWPARQLLGVGRQMLGKSSAPVRDASGALLDQEALVLKHILDSTLIRLQGELLDTPENKWWQALNAELRQQLPQIRARFDEASAQARKAFEPEIDKAATRLYEQLKRQPTLLNTLRAARASTDAAGVALAVKSGGLAPADLILAPAMLSVTSLLTESALGRYLQTVKNELKQRQREHIRRHVLDNTLQDSLTGLTTQLSMPELLTTGIEPALMSKLDACRRSDGVSTGA